MSVQTPRKVCMPFVASAFRGIAVMSYPKWTTSEIPYLDCHSGLDPESSISTLDSRFRENDSFGINVKKRWTHYTKRVDRDQEH